MENATSVLSDSVRQALLLLVAANQVELEVRYQQVLRELLFNGRSTMRPNRLKQIAADEVESFKRFLAEPQPSAVGRGAALHQAGLSEQPVMRLGATTRHFLVGQLPPEQLLPALALIDTYQEQIVQGFVQSLEKAVFTVQEMSRQAYERVVTREKV